MQTTYSSEYMDHKSQESSRSPVRENKTGKPWNVSVAREQLKVPFEPPRNFSTIYNQSFANRKGSEEVGALTKDGFVS